MKIIYTLIILLVMTSCSRPSYEEVISVEKFKEAALRTKQIYQVDKNFDKNNSLEMSFDMQYTDQLVELNFKLLPMNSSLRTLNNSLSFTGKALKNLNPVLSEEVKIYLDNTDITSCLIAECNSTSCTGNETSITSISNGFSSNSLYLNFNKLSSNGLAECSSLSLNMGAGTHFVRFEEVGTSVVAGGRLSAQLIVYNRTYSPLNISNAFE